MAITGCMQVHLAVNNYGVYDSLYTLVSESTLDSRQRSSALYQACRNKLASVMDKDRWISFQRTIASLQQSPQM